MLMALAVATITNVALNFRDYGYQNAVEKSKMTAEIVRDGLTAHMVNDMMDKRDFFLSNIANIKDVKSLWIVRSENVIKQYGDGMQNEKPRDDIDRQVLAEGISIRDISENEQQAILRVTIPYVATAYGNPNCLSCHNVAEGEVLGAISMEFDINDVRQTGAMTVLKIFGINVVFIIIALFVTNYYFKPYMRLFENLQTGIKKAHTGDFSFRFTTKLSDSGNEVAEQMNTLFQKIELTLEGIKYNLSTFISSSNLSSSDPLDSAGKIIEELSDVYKFKRTIELDTSKKQVYERIAHILHKKFNIEHFAIYEIDKESNTRRLIHITNGNSFCLPSVDKNAIECRSYRVNRDVYSLDFDNICTNCAMDKEYTCIPFEINDNYTLVLSYSSKSRRVIEEINKNIPNILSYLDAAKPIIESHILMDKLRDSSLKDAATHLYNRRFLENFIEQTSEQALRADVAYSILMIDIDYFKSVNDNYGHDSGDLVIKTLAQEIQRNIRKSDIAIRYGGEEFLVILYNTTNAGAIQVAQKIKQEFQNVKFNFKDEVIQKTISIGVSHFPQQNKSIWGAIKYADIALYEAKNSGRDKIVEFNSSMDDADLEVCEL